MARKRDAAKEVDKAIRNASANLQQYKDSVNAVTVAPGVQAAKKVDKMRANTLAAIDSGKWAENTAAVGLQDWQARTAGKGADRLIAGMEDSRDKTVDFRQQLIDYQNTVVAKLDAMPDTTPEQREQKMLANVREMRKFKRSARRR